MARILNIEPRLYYTARQAIKQHKRRQLIWEFLIWTVCGMALFALLWMAAELVR